MRTTLRRLVRPRSRKALPWGLAIIPGATFGFLAPVPFLYLAVRYRMRRTVVAAVVYLAGSAAEWAAITAPDGSPRDDVGVVVFMVLTVVGTAHAYAWRETFTDRISGGAQDPPYALPGSTFQQPAQTSARLQRTLAELTSVVERGDFPVACRRLFTETAASLTDVLTFVAHGGNAAVHLQSVEAMIEDYLPTSVHTYARLPGPLARTRRNADGLTAAGELELQLRLLRDAAREISGHLYDEDALRLQQQSAFLRDKYGRSELDLPPVEDASPVGTDVRPVPELSPFRPRPKTRH